MQTTGIVRPIDSLGRIVLPIELRKNLNLETKDLLEIFLKGVNYGILNIFYVLKNQQNL